MRNLFAALLITSLGFAASAQASDVSNYILQKQFKAQQTKRNTQMLVQQLRAQPRNVVSLADITPKSGEQDGEKLMRPEDFDHLETAAGGTPPAPASKIAKISSN